MRFNFLLYPFLFIIFLLNIQCLKVDILGNNQFVRVSLNASDVTFSVYVNGSGCYESDRFNITPLNPGFSISTTYTAPNNNCNKLTLISNAIIADTAEINFTMPLMSGSLYSLYIVTNNVITEQQTFKTIDGKSSAMGNVLVTSQFGINSFQLSWSTPATPNGQILGYNIWINTTGQNCVNLWIMSCVDCLTTTMGVQDSMNMESFCQITNRSSFNSNNASFILASNNSQISPYTNYIVSLVAINGYGWGAVTYVSFMTSQYTSGAVIGLNMTSSYPNSPMYLTWTPPTLTNGQVVQYIVLVQNPSNNNCIAWLTIVCSDCSNIIIGTSGDTGIRNNCPIAYYSGIFTMTSITVSVSVSSLIQPYTMYNVSVVPVNGYGWGNTSSITQRTSPNYPTMVRNFECNKLMLDTLNTNKKTYALNCNWTTPIAINDQTVTYNIDCSNGSYINTGQIMHPQTSTILNASVLPDKNYICTIKACNSVGCSPTSQINVSIPPEPPIIPNVTIVADVMANSSSSPTPNQIPITLPHSFITDSLGRIHNYSLIVVVNSKEGLDSRTIKTYQECDKGNKCSYVIILPFPDSPSRKKRAAPETQYSNVEFTIGDNHDCKNCNGPLNPSTQYLIGYQLCTSSGCFTVIITKSTKVDPTVIAVPIVIVLIVAVTMVVVLILKRRSLPLLLRRIQPPVLSTVQSSDSPICTEETFLESLSPTVDEYATYYQSIKTGSHDKASEQFILINQKQKELENENILVNADVVESKNRYGNIVPYEHNIMKLEPYDDYINASRICIQHCSLAVRRHQQCDCSNYYIATQGPIGDDTNNKTQTIGNFWQLVLQCNVGLIVNLTKCMESNKEKCAQYWPEIVNKETSYISGDGIVRVTLKRMDITQAYDERTFLVSMENKERLVTQLHFTAWNGHRSPNGEEFLGFYKRYKKVWKGDTPVLVHCSAGVGRTGTFIAIDIQLKKIMEPSNKIDIFDNVLKLRQCRCYMVQTENQYLFVHEIIYEYLKRKGIIHENARSAEEKASQRYEIYMNPSFILPFEKA